MGAGVCWRAIKEPLEDAVIERELAAIVACREMRRQILVGVGLISPRCRLLVGLKGVDSTLVILGEEGYGVIVRGAEREVCLPCGVSTLVPEDRRHVCGGPVAVQQDEPGEAFGPPGTP